MRKPFIYTNLFLLCVLPVPRLRAQTGASSAILPGQAVQAGRWTWRYGRGGLLADYDDVPLTGGGNVQLFTDGGRGLYGAGSNPPVPIVEMLPDGGRAYITHYHYEPIQNEQIQNEPPDAPRRVLDVLQRIEAHPANLLTFAIRAHWSGNEPVRLEWNPLRLWADALVGADYVSHSAPNRLDGGAPDGEAENRNRPSKQTENDAIVTGHIGFTPRAGGLAAWQLSPGWRRLNLRHTGVGDITLTEEGGVNDAPSQDDLPIVYDAREDANLRSSRIFWGGHIGLKLLPGQDVTRRITLTLAPHAPEPPLLPAPHANPDAPASLPARLVRQRPDPASPLLNAQNHPLIVPRPKQAKFSGDDFTIGRTLTICAEPFAENLENGKGDRRLVPMIPFQAADTRVLASLHRFGDELHAQTGTNVRFVHTPSKCDLRVFIAPAGPSTPPASLMKEGYRLHVGSGKILLMARDQAGAFYGLQTLRQLRVRRPNGRQAFAGVEMRDWPALPFRGAHIFVGKNALPFHKKLIERIFARYKMNALVIECEYTAWKSHPEIHAPNSMPPDDLRAEVAFARDRFLEPIPLVNSLGHSQWMFANRQHLDLAEDPQKPYAYDASNPETYKLLFDIYGETLDIFHPRFFHIGHDEVKIPGEDTFGRYPHRPENIRKGVTRLFVDDTNRLADWLRARHVRPILWADMLLHESEGNRQPNGALMTAANAPNLAEARARRAQMPRDAILADWRYAAGSEQRNGLDVLGQAGFDTLGCAWYEPGNIEGWARQAAQNHALGTLQTTWAGYDSREDLLETEYKQFAAYVLAAENAWTGGEKGQVEGGSEGARKKTASAKQEVTSGSATAFRPSGSVSPAALFARAYRDEDLGGAQTGWKLDLRGAANVRLTDGKGGAFPLAPYPSNSSDPSSLPASGNPRLSPDAFPAAILLRGALNLFAEADPAPATTEAGNGHAPLPLPAAISLPVHAGASALIFEHACVCGVENNALVGAYTVLYADGQRAAIPLRYGHQIAALDDNAPSDSFSTDALPILVGRLPLTLRRLRWPNPRPTIKIDRIEFRAADLTAAPLLFGVMGVQ